MSPAAGLSNIGKPYREIYWYALDLAHSNAVQSVMVGNTLSTDILDAANVGMDSVLIIGKESMAYDDLKTGKTFKLVLKMPTYLLSHV